MMNIKIVLDPGHGGYDGGADGVKIHEAPVVLAICQYIKPALESLGAEVRLTRVNDTYVELGGRCEIANDWNAHYFVSVHLNSDGPGAEGIESLYATEHGKELATPIHDTLIAATGERDRGLKQRDDLYVLNGTKMPAAMFELGFISNPPTETRLATVEYQQLLAWAIVTGLGKFIGIPSGPAKGVPA